MAERRFSLLERDSEEKRDEHEVGAEQPAAPALQRALERDGELGTDESGTTNTHYCQTCEAETRDGVVNCYNCGGRIGGPEQAAFNALKRREIAERAHEKERARRRAEAVEQARERVRSEREQEAERERGGRPAEKPSRTAQSGLDPRMALAVVWVCLFATVSATIHLFLSAAYSDQVNWSVLAEVAIAAIATWVVFTLIQNRA